MRGSQAERDCVCAIVHRGQAAELKQYGIILHFPLVWSQTLSQDEIRGESSARQMSNDIVKPCQANEGADNKTENRVQFARGQDGTWAPPGRYRPL